MEVVPMQLPKNGPNGTVDLPFNRRNVEEWSRLDRLTGIMETAKIETDHWAARTSNAAHKYGKVVDSRERNNADGSLQERQRKQMEVFQTKIPGGSMQVIRTQTITTSSRKWSSASDKVFDDLTLPVNSLDLTSQKTKGSVGRSGSIGGRRPPTRPRSLISRSSDNSAFEDESSVLRLSQRVHQQQSDGFRKKDSEESSERSGVVIMDVTGRSSPIETSLKNGLSRQRSCSNENLTNDSDNESLLRRSSKVRRSLQCHKQNHASFDSDQTDEYESLPTKSLKERAAEIEKLLGRKSGTQSSPTPDRSSDVSYGKIKFLRTKDSFVSAETLKEVRERLKKPYQTEDNESKDDGIVTEKNDFGLSAKINGHEAGSRAKPSVNGTGSLESRYTNKSSANGSRTSEWYRRRKSYGFEQVDEYEKFDKFNGKKKNHIDSSTDSGICQSTETMGPQTWTKNSDSIWTKTGWESGHKKDPLSNVITVRVKKDLPMDSFIDKGINSVYLDGLHSQSYSPRKDGETKKMFDYGQDDTSSTIKNSWTNENIKSSLRSAKNPWLSQLRGTKLVDRDWSADESTTPTEEKTQQSQQQQQQQQQQPTSAIFDRKEEFNGDGNGQKKSKKVEFCKTEVHFAAESGKFNIVETNGKPPPNEIFRRRRRPQSSTSSIKDVNVLPEIRAGDSFLDKTVLTKPEKVESISEKIEAELKELSRIVIEALPQSEKRTENGEGFKRKNSLLYDVAEETLPNSETSNLSKPRSILKSYGNSFEPEENDLFKPSKPHDVLNRLSQRSPVPVWQSTVVLRNKRYDDVKRTPEEDRKLYSSDGESELQNHIRNMRKTNPEPCKKLWTDSSYDRKFDSTGKRRSLPDDVFLRNPNGGVRGHGSYSSNLPRDDLSPKTSVSTDEMPTLSVAERIKQVEQLKQSNNYSTKINFRSGEMTVVQNGASTVHEVEPMKKTMTSWAYQRKMSNSDDAKTENQSHRAQQPLLSCDELTTSNPPVTRFSTHADKTDNQKYQTTRILINFKTSPKNDTTTTTTKTTDKTQSAEKMINNTINNNNNNQHKLNDSCGSWTAGSPSKKDLTKYLKEFKSTSLVRETIRTDQSQSPQQQQQQQQQREDIPKPSKPVHEIIDQFDSLSRSTLKEKKRKPIPYRTSKEYTHSDLEEELKNFTENLDKDFRDIYEEEIGSFRKSRSLRETKSKSADTLKMESLVRPVIQPRTSRYLSMKSSSGDEAASRKSSLKTSSRDNYDTDDSDLLADEEVRSYMSTGHGGSESETEGSGSRKSFQESILRFKKLESQTKEEKEIKSNLRGLQNVQTSATLYPKSTLGTKLQEVSSSLNKSPKIASIALKYEDDPLYSKRIYQNLKSLKNTTNTDSNDLSADVWERTSNSSSAMSGGQPRGRVSYLNGLSLSEKYSKNIQRSSNSSMDTIPDGPTIRRSETFPDEDPDGEYSPKTDKKYLNGFVKRDRGSQKSQKEEKYAVEKSCTGRYVAKTERPDPSKRRTKTDQSEKTSSGKSLIDRYQMKRSERIEAGGRNERDQTDGDLEELKKAAEEIIMAVNGYTDESSHVGSSDDDRSRRVIRKDKIGNLGTISEGKRVTKTETKKTTSTHAHRRKTRNQSSASSTESLNKESLRPSREARSSSRHRHGESGTVGNGSSKPSSSRTSRSLHRATREAIIGHRSSSEDIPSCVEQVKRRVTRRQKTSSKPEVTSETKTTSTHRHRSKSRGTESPVNSATKTSKSDKARQETGTTRASRSSRTTDPDKTRSSSSHRKITAEKTDVEMMKRRRSQRMASGREERSSEQTHRKRSSSNKKPEASKISQPM